MGKKNKYKNDPTDDKKPADPTQAERPGPSTGHERSQVGQQRSTGRQQEGQQQQGRGQQQNTQSLGQQGGARNQQTQGGSTSRQQEGQQQQQGRVQQQNPQSLGQQGGNGQQQGGAWGPQNRGGNMDRQQEVQQQQGRSQQQKPQSLAPQGGGGQQGGAWGPQQRGGRQGEGNQQRNPQSLGQQGGSVQQQGGAWNIQNQGGSMGRQQGGQQQQGRSQQQKPQSWAPQGGGDQQGGAWGTQQRGGRQGEGDQQRGPNKSMTGRQQEGQQQGGARNQQTQGGSIARQQDGQQHHQRGPPQQGRGQQQNPQSLGQQGGNVQQGGLWNQQHRGGRQGEGDQQRSSNQSMTQQQYGRGQQQQQKQTVSLNSTENPLPVMEKSCNGIVRGNLGTPGIVEVNYLRLNLDKMPNEAFHYDITITPDRPKKFLRPAFEQFKRELYPEILLAFDGFKNCYSIERLKSPVEHTVNVQDSGNRMKEFKVQLKETDSCSVDLKSLRTYQTERIFDKPMRALQVLEVILASSNHERGIRVGRSFFRRPLDAYYLEDGYEAWTGLYQAAILGEMPLLNVDIAHKSFPCESTLIEYLNRMGVNDKNKDLSNDYVLRDITTFLKGINVIYTPPTSFGASPKQYKVLGVGDPASRRTFKTDDGKELTVESYFRSKGYTLKYPHLNCLNVGSTVRQISLPMELCSIPQGQALNRKDQGRQVDKMIRYAATSTNKRKEKIMDLLGYFNHNVNSIIRGFGLSIGSSFLKVPMRLLPSPSIEYLQGQTVRISRGAWRMDNKRFLICSKPQNGHKWAILYEVPRGRGISYHDLESFRTAVCQTSKSLNMNLQSTAEIQSYNRFTELQPMLKKLAGEKYDLVFVVLSERGTTYAKIKQIAELEVGILTQCIKDKTIFRTSRDKTVFSNILLKVNGKLNGTNHKIAIDRDSNLLSPIKNVMYLGADVTHPSPDQRHIPSVVGVAASHDQYGACYNCQYRLQRSTVENIEDMESIASRHLQVYFNYQNSYPQLIIYYRDGVSDGQFPIVEREEIRAIKRACAKVRCNPKLTCIIVVKRHHTRFFPLRQPEHDRDFNNVEAGTVVDQYIAHPNEVQFFMVSHQSIQGTARPTRYNVIMDESKFDINLLQKLTYYLCHLFPRCNRAVSYPAPAYLAHLVAFRGRVYLEGTQRFDTNLKREYDKRLIKPDFINKNPMYFI